MRIRLGSVVGLVVLAVAALAADHPQHADKLVLKSSGTKSSLVWSAKLPPVVPPSANPTVVGATLFVSGTSGEMVALALPAAAWTQSATGSVLRFRNADAPSGLSVVKVALLSAGKIVKVAARSSGITLDEAMQGAVSIALVVGSDAYCSTCQVPIFDGVGRYVAKACAAPIDCAFVPTTMTSTTTSTTTSTFVPGICGNNVVDQPSEACDGVDPGLCDDVVPPFPVTCDVPTSPTPCQCCSPSQCILFGGGSTLCCGGSTCQDTTGVGAVRGGACIPATCTTDAECNGYTCEGGACCGEAGELCGVVGCCASSGATCQLVAGNPVCCRPSGASCGAFNECCSWSCTAGVCD